MKFEKACVKYAHNSFRTSLFMQTDAPYYSFLNWERGKGAVVCLQLDGDIENLKMDHSCRNRNVNLLSLFLA